MAEPAPESPLHAVRVILFDAVDGRAIAEGGVPAGALSDVFTTQTRMHLGEQEQGRRDGRSTAGPRLAADRLRALHPLVARAEATTALRVWLDDWRQIEFVAAASADLGAGGAALADGLRARPRTRSTSARTSRCWRP